MASRTDQSWAFAPQTIAELRAVMQSVAGGRDEEERMAAVLDQICRESHAAKLRAEHVVQLLRATWSTIDRPLSSSTATWDRFYVRFVDRCLTVYFADERTG